MFRLKHSPVAARMAGTLAGEARSALERGDVGTAEARSAHALRLDDGNEEAQEVLRMASGLRESGFRAGEEDGPAEEAPSIAPARAW